MQNNQKSRWILLAIFIGVFILLITNMSWLENALRFLFPGESQVIHPRASLLVMVGEHL